MKRYEPLSSSAETAYAQALDAALGADLSRSVADLSGTFARKAVKGRVYWYYQFIDLAGERRQIYVGPDNDRVRALVAAKEAGEGAAEALRPLAQSAVVLGNAPMAAPHFKIIRRLGEHGFFRAGGVLVGTHAFLACGNMLGVRWSDAQRTQDVDFAHAGRSLSVALPADVPVSVNDALASLEMGLLPIQHADVGNGATYMNPRDPALQVDFVTPWCRTEGEPYAHPALGTMLQPIKFMEYLLEDVQQAVVFGRAGAAVVNVPDPARLAVHKVLVAGDRPVSRAGKAAKDVVQAAALFAYYRESDPEGLQAALSDLARRGPGWRSRLAAGWQMLARRAPDLGLDEWLDPSGRHGAGEGPEVTTLTVAQQRLIEAAAESDGEMGWEPGSGKGMGPGR
jgi:hypothetical protein